MTSFMNDQRLQSLYSFGENFPARKRWLVSWLMHLQRISISGSVRAWAESMYWCVVTKVCTRTVDMDTPSVCLFTASHIKVQFWIIGFWLNTFQFGFALERWAFFTHFLAALKPNKTIKRQESVSPKKTKSKWNLAGNFSAFLAAQRFMPKVLSVYENTVIISRMRRSMLFLWKVERIIENMNAVGIKCRHFRESLSAETHCQPHQHYEIKLNIEWRVQYIQKHGV